MSKIINKAYRDYNHVSRYSSFPYYYHTVDDKYIYGRTAYLKDTTSYSYYQTVRGDTFDSIALRFYNNPTFYWVICSFNHIQDPYLELREGTILRIPVLSEIQFDT